MTGVDTLDSIRDVDPATWNALAGPDDFYESHEWLTSVEADTTAQSRYLVASRGGHVVGALPLYRVTFEGNALYRPERLQALLGAEGEYLIAGARRCYRSDVLLAPDLAPDAADDAVRALVRAALRHAARDGLSGVLVPYLSTRAVARLGRVAPVVVAFDSAEAVVPGADRGIDVYLQQLSRSRRANARKELAAIARSQWHTGVERLGECLPEAASLMSQVERRHGHETPDVLLARVLRRQARAADERSVVFTCRDDDGGLVACGLHFVWRDTLYARAVGMDYERLDDSFEYFDVLLYRAVQYAAQHGLRRLHLGIESWWAKVLRGAVLRPLWSAVVRAADDCGDARIDVVDADAAARWSEEFRRVDGAVPPDEWSTPVSESFAEAVR